MVKFFGNSTLKYFKLHVKVIEINAIDLNKNSLDYQD